MTTTGTNEQTAPDRAATPPEGPVSLVLTFQGPRSAELLDAADRAGRERLGPALSDHPGFRDDLVGMLVLRQPNGHELVVITVRSLAALDVLRDLVTTSTLLPGEDVRLLPGPDRAEIFKVVEMRGFDIPEVSR